MYIIDDICYAGEKTEEIKVHEAKALKGGMLLVTFTTGEKRLYDTTLLEGSAFKPLQDEKIFQNFSIFHGIITWDDGKIDIAPETVYADSYPYTSTEID